jgi:hypothetical protein
LSRATGNWYSRALNENLRYHPETGLIVSTSIDQMFGKLVSRLIGKVDKTILLELVTLLSAWRNGLNKNHLNFDPSVNYTNYCKEAPSGTNLGERERPDIHLPGRSLQKLQSATEETSEPAS